MNNEAESSRAAQDRYTPSTSHTDTRQHEDIEDGDYYEEEEEIEEEDPAERERRVKQRRLDARRKRILFLDHLLKEMDMLIFVELIALYHLDCSFFWFAVRSIVHCSILTPFPDMGFHHQHDEHKPYLPLILMCFIINFLLHSLCAAPSAGEDTRGYLHGGLMIDFIGQEGPTSKWKLVGLDTCILLLQLVMVSVHVKRRESKKTVAQMSGESETRGTTEEGQGQPTEQNTDGNQDADSEERGVLRRTDTMSDVGAEAEEDALLPRAESGRADALDLLISGQCIIGELTLIETLMDEHHKYEEYRRTGAEGGVTSSLSPAALRHLHRIRTRFGVGGG